MLHEARLVPAAALALLLSIAAGHARDYPRPGYADLARTELAPFRAEAVDEIVARELLPRLLSSGGGPG